MSKPADSPLSGLQPAAGTGPSPEPSPEQAHAEPGAEDAKLVTLARAARARTGAAQGAAVRDGDGRSYAATDVALPSFRLSALRAALAQAVASGAKTLEAAALVSESPLPAADDLSALRELGGPGTPVVLAGPDGAVIGMGRAV